MNLRTIYCLLALAAFLPVLADSPARQANAIKKNSEQYISAEATADNEDKAMEEAAGLFCEKAREFLNSTIPDASFSDADIQTVTKLLSVPRGEFVRIFLYADRADLIDLAKGGTGKAAPSTEAEGSADAAPITAPDAQAGQTAENYAEENDGNTSIKIPKEVEEALIKTAEVPAAITEMIFQLFKCPSLKEAVPILNKYKNRNAISKFGTSQDCKNPAACFWVVEDNGQLTVLGPERSGYRFNFRYGAIDFVESYHKGIWFRN